jgi:hypothetical protein
MFALGVGIDFCLTVLAGEFIFDKKFFPAQYRSYRYRLSHSTPSSIVVFRPIIFSSAFDLFLF